MKNIQIAVADEDVVYLKQLTNYLISSEHKFNIFSFSKIESLVSFLNDPKNKTDILLLSEDMRCTETDRCNASVKIILSDEDIDEIDGYESVKKYQKTSNLMNSVMLIYGTNSGHADALSKGERSTRYVGVYSPVGGSGKTTLALILSHTLAQQGKKVFYQNLENIDSTRNILPMEAQMSLSDLLVDIRTKENGTGLKLISKMCTPQKIGFSYINPPDSSLELNEVSIDEKITLLKELGKISQFDVVMLDFESELNSDKLCLLQMCDKVIVPILPDVISINKMMQLFREIKLREELSSFKGKAIYVVNKIGQGTDTYLRQVGIYEHCSPTAMIPLSENIRNIGVFLQNGVAGDYQLQGIVERIFN